MKHILNQINHLLSIVTKDKDSVKLRDVFNPAIKFKIKKYPELNRLLNSAPEIWLGSDWHLWKKGDRSNPKAKEIIKHQKLIVKPNDVFIMLGDIVHRDTYNEDIPNLLKTIIPTLKGKKVLILGNHDIYDKQFYYDCGFDHVNDGFLWKDYVFSHVPLHFTAFQGAKYNIHGHTHGYNGDRKVPYKNHVCVYTEALGNKPISIDDLMVRYHRYKRRSEV